MAGLLDLFGDSPEDPRSMAILAAGQGLLSQRGMRGLLSGAQGYVGAMAQAKERERQLAAEKLKQELLREQIAETKAQAVQRMAAAAQTQALMKAREEYLRKLQSPDVAGSGLPIDGVRAANPGRGGLAGMSINDIAGAKLVGLPDLTKDWELSQTGGPKQEAGAYYGGKYMPKLGEGMGMANGRVAPVPGYMEGQAALTGAVEGAKREATSPYDFTTVTGPNGEPRIVSVRQAKQLLEQQGGGIDIHALMQADALNSRQPVKFDFKQTGQRGAYDKFGDLALEMMPKVGDQKPLGIKTGASPQDRINEEYDKDVMKDVVARRKNIFDSAELATNRIHNFRRIDQLLGAYDGGKLSPLGLDIASAANTIGIKIDPKLGNKQAAESLANEMALQLRNPSAGAGMPGSLSNEDRDFLKNTIPGIAHSADGRRMMIQTAIALESRKVEVAEFARKYEAKYGRLDEKFYSQLANWASKNPLFVGGGGATGEF